MRYINNKYLTYSEATRFMNDLRSHSIKCGVSQGRVGIYINSDEELAIAKSVASKHKVGLTTGQTYYEKQVETLLLKKRNYINK